MGKSNSKIVGGGIVVQKEKEKEKKDDKVKEQANKKKEKEKEKGKSNVKEQKEKKKDLGVKKEKKKFEKAGQKRATPSSQDPLYIFYTSLYRQNKKSQMAMMWCLEHGVFTKEKAEKLTMMIQLGKLSLK